MGLAIEPPESRIVEETLRISVPEAGMTLAEIESLVWSAASAAARDAVSAVCAVMEADAVVAAGETVTLDRRRPLNVLTRFGWVRLTRWYVRDRADNGYRHPLDEVLRLGPRQHASPWVIQQAAMLGAGMPVRRAADFLTAFLETNVDHRTLHSLVRQSMISIVNGAGRRRPAAPPAGKLRQKSDS